MLTGRLEVCILLSSLKSVKRGSRACRVSRLGDLGPYTARCALYSMSGSLAQPGCKAPFVPAQPISQVVQSGIVGAVSCTLCTPQRHQTQPKVT